MGEVAGMVLSAGGALVTGAGNASARKSRAASLRLQADAGRLAASQTDLKYRENLEQTLANIDAIRTGQNASIDSPTSGAIRSEARRRNDQSRKFAVASQRIGARQKDIDALTQKRLADLDVLGGGLNAAVKLAGVPTAIMRAGEPKGAKG